MKFLKTYKIHFICWPIYIGYEVLLTGTLNGRFSHYLTYILFYSIEIGLFYAHAFLVMPLLNKLSRKSLFNWIAALIGVLAIYTLMLILSSFLLDVLGVRKTPLILSKTFFLYLSWRAVLFLMFGTGYYFIRRYVRQKSEQTTRLLELERMKTKMAQLESDYLRAQISPHLLFNTLNFIKFAAKHHPDQSDEAIMLLTETLDFSLSNSQHGLILLKDEIKQVENIIRINRLRFNGRIYLDFKKELDFNGKMVPPISILSLIENLFKHGDLSKSSFPALFYVSENKAAICIKTENLIRTVSISDERRKCSGLNNLKERMDSFYGEDNYVFKYGNHGDIFKLELTFPIISDLQE